MMCARPEKIVEPPNEAPVWVMIARIRQESDDGLLTTTKEQVETLVQWMKCHSHIFVDASPAFGSIRGCAPCAIKCEVDPRSQKKARAKPLRSPVQANDMLFEGITKAIKEGECSLQEDPEQMCIFSSSFPVFSRHRSKPRIVGNYTFVNGLICEDRRPAPDVAQTVAWWSAAEHGGSQDCKQHFKQFKCTKEALVAHQIILENYILTPASSPFGAQGASSHACFHVNRMLEPIGRCCKAHVDDVLIRVLKQSDPTLKQH